MTARAFITGIGGQDGTYLAERLVEEGMEVHALVLEADGHPAHCPDEVVLHAGDLGDLEATRRLLHEVAPREVYNLAAISSVAQSWDQPDRTAHVNGQAAVALMESARQLGDVRVVQASSAEIFGEPSESPQTEETAVRPVNPYGAAKAFAHLSAHVLRQRDLHVSSVILYNHESPRRHERFVTRKITATVAAIARGEADELVLGNLDARRDWGWAPDYVDAMVRAARAPRAVRLRRRDRAGRTPCATSSPPPSPLSTSPRPTGSRWSAATPPSSAPPTRPSWSATRPAPATCSAGSRRWRSRRSWPGWWPPTSTPPLVEEVAQRPSCVVG